jgi:hypothetical protein
MKYFLVLFIVGFGFTFPCIAQQTRADFNLQGEVQSISEVSSSIEGKWLNDTSNFTFNPNGLLIEQTTQSNDMSCSYQKTYDENGNVIIEKCAGCSHRKDWINTYNDKDLLVKTEIPFNRQTTSFSYNESDQLIRIETVDSSGLVGSSFLQVTLQAYDVNGNLNTKEKYRADQQGDSLKLILHELNTYNDSSKIIVRKLIHFGRQGMSITNERYKYNDVGNLIWRNITYENSPREEITEFTYQQNQITSEMSTITYLNKRKLKTYQRGFHYDSFGNVTKYIDHSITHIYKYKFDSRGNWIEKTVINDGKAVINKTRAITYFQQ